jgi:hypothetical protein
VAKSKSPKLKVYETQIGFYDTVVAAPSQSAALRAWGMHQNLFASGDAHITADESAIAAAVVHPEKPLRRPVGSTEPFLLEPISLPKFRDAPKKQKSKEAHKSKPPPKPAADRTELNVAEASLRDLGQNRKQEEENFRREEEALAAKRAAAQTSYVHAHKAADLAIAAAREKYRKAGGTE